MTTDITSASSQGRELYHTGAAVGQRFYDETRPADPPQVAPPVASVRAHAPIKKRAKTMNNYVSAQSMGQRQLAAKVIAALTQRGHFAAAVGGCTRDELLGRTPKDWDVVTSARPEEVEDCFSRTIPLGRAFGIVVVVEGDVQIEVATLRVDGAYTDGRHPDEVSFAMSFEQDALRRDLTINAMAKNIVTGEIFDPIGGRADLDARIIRAVGDPFDRIAEDKLRMLRALRFMSQLAPWGFTLDPALKAAITANAELIKVVSGERVRDEFEKILCSSHPLVALDLMMETGLMHHILPELVALNGPGGDQDPVWHPEGNVWVHTRLVVQGLVGSPFTLMLGGLLHDVGKPATQVRQANGRISNHGHDAKGAEIAEAICRRLKMSNDERRTVRNYVALHMTMHDGPEMRPAKLARLLQRDDLPELIALQHADAMGKDGQQRSLCGFYANAIEQMRDAANASQRLDAEGLIDGDMLIDMGYKPGPQFRVMIDRAFEEQMEGVFWDAEGARRFIVDTFGEPPAKRM